MAEDDDVTKAIDDQQNFRIQKVYIKDVSFESPKSPNVFLQQNDWKPEVNLQINSESRVLQGELYETVLTLTVTVKSGQDKEETAYLVEVKQAGLFVLQGFNDQNRANVLGSYCPNILFPFAREVVADLVVKGGFPQLLLEPINFDALYAQHMEISRQNAPATETRQ